MEGEPIRIKRVSRPHVEEAVADMSDMSAPEVVLARAGGAGGEENSMTAELGYIFNRIARGALFALVFLLPIFFLPLTVAPVEIHKQVLAMGLLLLAFAAYLGGVIERRRITYPAAMLSIAILGLVVAFGLSTFLSRAVYVSVLGGFLDTDTLAVVLTCALAYFLASNFIKREDLPRIFALFVSGITLAVFLGLLQMFGKFFLPWDFTRQTGFNTFGSFSRLGIFMGMVLAMLAVAPLERFGPRAKWVLSAIGVVMFLGLVVINYQLLWFGLAFFMIAIAALRFVNQKTLGLPLVIAIVALFFALVSSHLPVFAQLPPEVRPSFSSTLQITRDTLSGWRLPIGSGPATFGYDYSLYRPFSLNATDFWSVRFAQGYNYIATILATSGLLGFLALLFVIFAAFRLALKNSHNEDMAILFAGIIFLVLQWFVYPAFFMQSFYIFLGLGIAVGVIGTKRHISFERASRYQAFGVFLLLIALVAVSLSLLYLAGQRYVAAAYYGKGVEAYNRGDVNQSLSYLNSAVNLDGQRDEYWRIASQAVLAQVRSLVGQLNSTKSADLRVPVQTGIANAVQVARHATELNSADSLNWVNLGNVYESLIGLVQGSEKFAADNYKLAMTLAPRDPSIPLQLGRALASVPQGDMNTAEDWMQKALNLKPDYAAAHFLLAQLYIKEGQTDKAIAKVEEIKAQNPTDFGIAFQLGLLYYQNGQMEKAQGEFERAVGLNGNYSNARYFLGLIYDRKGLKSQALDQFQKIAALNPDNNEIKQIVANLQAGRSALSTIVPPATAPEKRKEPPVTDNATSTH